MADDNKNRLLQKLDIKHLAILTAIALAIGIYLIITTVLISKDGAFYIARAQQLTSDPISAIKIHPPGYPILILAAHNFTSLFTNSSSVYTWIYSAQSVTLLCRVLAIISLYFIASFGQIEMQCPQRIHLEPSKFTVPCFSSILKFLITQSFMQP